MKTIVDLFILKKEAELFDSRLFILKAFLSIITIYAIASVNPLLKKDMISVLFGLLLTLEPVTITGIRSGLNQIYATVLGAICTALIITLFGINIWTIALSVSTTLFVSLKINWREVSPVAIFTSIYMTQYVQLTAEGLQSPYLTFQLRILALGAGVFTAISYNFLFSLFSYRRMEEKRIAFIIHALQGHLSQISDGLSRSNDMLISDEKIKLPQTFNTIDWTYSLLTDKKKEASVKKRFHIKNNQSYLHSLQKVVQYLRNITHLSYDICYNFNKTDHETIDKQVIEYIKTINQSLEILANYFEKAVNGRLQIPIKKLSFNEDDRLLVNLNEIVYNIDCLLSEIKNSR